MKNLSENLTAENIAEISENAVAVLNDAVNWDEVTEETARNYLACVALYKELLTDKLDKAIDSITGKFDTDSAYQGVVYVGNLKVSCELKETVKAKAVGLTNKELKAKYVIADSIISEDTKTITTLHKDNLAEAVKNQIPEVLQAIQDGALVFDKSNSRAVSIKSVL